MLFDANFAVVQSNTADSETTSSCFFSSSKRGKMSCCAMMGRLYSEPKYSNFAGRNQPTGRSQSCGVSRSISADPSKGECAREAGTLRIWPFQAVPQCTPSVTCETERLKRCLALRASASNAAAVLLQEVTVSFAHLFSTILMHSLGDVSPPASARPP